MDFAQRHYWNTHSYGKAVRIHKNTLQKVLCMLCVITPATNWMIPLIMKYVRSDAVIRYNTTHK